MNPVALQDQEWVRADRLLAAAVASSGDAIIGRTPEGQVLSWNEGAERLYGYSAEEMLGQDLAVLVPLERRRELPELLARVRRGESVSDLRTERRRKDGTRISVVLNVTPVMSPDGENIGFSTVARDLTESLRVNGDLQRASQTEGLLDTLLETAPVGIGFVNRDFRIVRMNDALASVNGSSVQQQIGRTVAEVVPDIWPQVEAVCHRVLDNEEPVLNVEVSGTLAADPEQIHHWLASYYPVRAEGEIIGVGIVAVDVTERINAEMAREELTRGAVAAISAMAEARDPYTAGHQRGVAEIANAIAKELGLAEEEVEGITLAAHIHDIGKVSVPAEILVRPGKLSPIEWEMVKGHSKVGFDIVAGITFPWPVAEMILQHHERIDGSGYPTGLRGEEILLGARIIAVADTVDAMASHRPYRPAQGLGAALDEIEQHEGTLFDSEVVHACLRLFREGGFVIKENLPWMPQNASSREADVL